MHPWRKAGEDAEAPAARTSSAQFAAVERHSLAHADQSVAGPESLFGRRGGHRRNTVIDDLDLDGIGRVPEHDVGSRRPGVLAGVGECFLHHSVRRHVDAARQWTWITFHAVIDVQSTALCVVEQFGQPIDARLGHQRVAVVVGAQEPDEAPEFVDGLSARLLDRAERGDGSIGVTVEHPSCAAGLHAHHAHVVGDDVVQLSRDPDPFVLDGAACPQFTLDLELSSPVEQLGLAFAADAEHVAHHPAGSEEREVERERERQRSRDDPVVLRRCLEAHQTVDQRDRHQGHAADAGPRSSTGRGDPAAGRREGHEVDERRHTRLGHLESPESGERDRDGDERQGREPAPQREGKDESDRPEDRVAHRRTGQSIDLCDAGVDDGRRHREPEREEHECGVPHHGMRCERSTRPRPLARSGDEFGPGCHGS